MHGCAGFHGNSDVSVVTLDVTADPDVVDSRTTLRYVKYC